MEKRLILGQNVKILFFFFIFLKLFFKMYDNKSEVNKMINQETLKLFDALYYETYTDVLNYVVIHCSHVEDVKDIVQNIYLDVLKKIEKNNQVFSKPYIIGIAKNKVKDYYRFHYKNKIISLFSSIKKQDGIDLIDAIEANIDIEKMIVKAEDIQFVWSYLKKQKTIVFKIFYLYYYRDYSIKDIAEELNIKESNVKNYLYRTLNKLQIVMKGRGGKDA